MLFFVPAVDMPSLGPLDLFFNVRSRYEQKSDVFFDNSDSDDRTLINTRARLGFDYDAGDNTNIRVTYQFSNMQIDDSEAFVPSTNNPFFNFNHNRTIIRSFIYSFNDIFCGGYQQIGRNFFPKNCLA